MGTLHNQPERSSLNVTEESVSEAIHDIKTMAESSGLSFDQVLSVYELLERRRKNDIYENNNDAK